MLIFLYGGDIIKKHANLMCLLTIILITLEKIPYTIPDKKYSYILNVDNYYTFNGALNLLLLLVVFFIFKNNTITRKFVYYLILAFLLFTIMITYYYSKLPSYTYNQAAEIILLLENKNGNVKTILLPKHHEDKTRKISRNKYFNSIHSIYNIYLLDSNNDIIRYKFNPINGKYEIIDKNYISIKEFNYE